MPESIDSKALTTKSPRVLHAFVTFSAVDFVAFVITLAKTITEKDDSIRWPVMLGGLFIIGIATSCLLWKRNQPTSPSTKPLLPTQIFTQDFNAALIHRSSAEQIEPNPEQPQVIDIPNEDVIQKSILLVTNWFNELEKKSGNKNFRELTPPISALTPSSY